MSLVRKFGVTLVAIVAVGATTLTQAGAVSSTPVNYRLSQLGTYYCFGMPATILDAKKTFQMRYVVVGYDENGDSILDWRKFYGGPQQVNRGANHTGIFNVFYGTPGDDVIVGTGKNDYIIGGGGHDRICALDGNDAVEVGGSTDTPGWVQVDGGRGNDNLLGGGISNVGTSFHAFGGPGNDILEGNGGNDVLDAGKDANLVYSGRSLTDSDSCFSGKTMQLTDTDIGEDYQYRPATNEENYWSGRDVVRPFDFNCEQNAAGRLWTNHATFLPLAPVPTTATPVTTTTTSH